MKSLFNQFTGSHVHFDDDSCKKGTKGWNKGLSKSQKMFVVLQKNSEYVFDSDSSTLNSSDIEGYKNEAR